MYIYKHIPEYISKNVENNDDLIYICNFRYRYRTVRMIAFNLYAPIDIVMPLSDIIDAL